MSLPDEILDELLSGHLDGVLSGDECARVEQLLRDNADVRSRFEQLKERRSLLAEAALPVPKLPATFADSVVQAAIETAQAEQLSAEHPLMLAAQASLSDSSSVQLSKSPGLDGKASALRIACVVGGLAASLMVAGFLLTRDRESGNQDSPNTLANLDPAADQTVDQTVAGGGINPIPRLPSEGIAASGSPSENAGSSEGEPVPGTLLAENLAGEASAIEKAMDVGNSTSPIEVDSVLPNSTVPDAVASTGQTTPGKIEPERAAAMPQLAALLVIEVKLSDVGRVAGAFDKAMETVAIQQDGLRQVSETVASAAESNLSVPAGENSGMEDSRLVLLEAPIKDLDRLVNQLANDVEGVEGLRFSMIDNAMILRGVQSNRKIDPTMVQHQGQSWPVTGEAEKAFAEWADKDAGRSFASLPKGIGVGQLSTPSSAGPNPKANLLILVR